MEVRVVMTHEHMLRTLGTVKGFVFLVAASVQLVLLAFAFALTGTAAAQNSIASGTTIVRFRRSLSKPRTRSKGNK